jgi:hypothetical protein
MQGNFQCSKTHVSDLPPRLANRAAHSGEERSCMMQIKQHLLDKRVVKRALQEGLLDKAAYQRTLDELPDLSHRIQTAQSSEEPAPAPAAAPAAPVAPPHEAAPRGDSFPSY